MDSITRFKFLISHQYKKLDRILIDYWASSEIDNRLINFYHIKDKEQLLDLLDVDFRYIRGPKYIGPELKIYEDGSSDDLWGVRRTRTFYGQGEYRGSYETVLKSPLSDATTIKDVENYNHWPEPEWYDYSCIPEQCDAVHEKKKVVMFMGDRLNRIAQLKPMMYIRGINKTLLELAKKESPIFDAILEKIRGFYKEYLKNILKAAGGKIDVIVTGDDFGQQNGLICRPDVWRQKLKPGFREFIQISKSFSIPVMHHTCGSVTPIIPDFIECGLNILNPIQPGTENMDHQMLKANFGNNLIFHGGISLQGPLRFGTPEEIAEEVRTCCNILGKNGGYIICSAHNLNADMKTENIDALFKAYQKFCYYK